MVINFSVQGASPGLPDFSFARPYVECLRYVQFCLRSLPHGALKPFTQLHKLTYTATVSLKSNNLKRNEPHLVQRVLQAFGFETQLIQVTLGGEAIPHFMFSSAKDLKRFQQQLMRLAALADNEAPQSQQSDGTDANS